MVAQEARHEHVVCVMTTDSQPTPEQVEWLTPGTAHYEHLHTKCVLAGWAAYRQHAGSEVVRSDAVVQATLNTVRDIFAAVERGES